MKYLKYFEDKEEYEIYEDPIIRLILHRVDSELCASNWKYEICEALYNYIQDYNEDIPSL